MGGGRGWLALLAVVAAVAGPAVSSPPASADVAFNQRMLDLVNRERAANGLNSLVANPVLAGVAEDAPYPGCGFPVAGRAADMGARNYFSHNILNCGSQSVFNILNSTSLGYSGAGENIAWVNAVTDPMVAAENLHSQLMSSPTHRANILSPNFNSLGIGSWRTAPGRTWSGAGYPLPNVYIVTQIFAGLPPGLGASATTTTTNPPSTAGARYAPLTPARILDTRNGTGVSVALPVGPNTSVDLQVTGRGGVPATGVSAVVMNVAVTQATDPSYLTAFPTGESRPFAANINFASGQTLSNLVVAKVGAGGKVSLYNAGGTVHVIADVAGWYDAGA